MKGWGPAIGLGLVLFAVGFLPLLGGPRYEAALVAGLVGPFWASCAGAFATRRHLTRLADGDSWTGDACARLGATVGGWHALAVAVVAGVHGLIGGVCEPLDGWAFLLGGACVGTALGGLGGALSMWVADWRRTGGVRRRWSERFTWLGWALLLPLWSVIVGLGEFYFTPAVYVFSPHVGFFAGPLYEPVVYPIQRLFTYRVGTALTVTAVYLAARWLRREGSYADGTHVDVRRGASRPSAGQFIGVGLLVLASILHTAAGNALGHRMTAASLSARLGGSTVTGSCEVLYDPLRSERGRVERLGRDCNAHLVQLSEYFEDAAPRQVRVYLFADEPAKAQAVGVGRTYVAKPWRGEIYVHEAGFPHPALGHELAHVVAGQFGQGPFRVAGRLGGLWPDPGRVEGFAVAASPREDSDATLLEWARAMRELGQLPPIERMFQVGFFGESAARSYMAAGAFVDFVHGQFGGRALRRWYGGESLEEATGLGLAELTRRYSAVLDRVKPAPEVLAEAAQRFSGKAIFARRCPHLVDRLSSQCEQLCPLDAEASADVAREILQIDGERFELQALAPRCLLLEGDARGAELRATELLGDARLSPWMRRSVLERRGDARWSRGDRTGARQDYERALADTPGLSAARQLEVRSWAVLREEPIGEAVRAVLVGPGSGVEAGLALGRVLGLAAEEPLAAYLAGRMLWAQEQPELALPWLERAARAEQPLPSVAREAARLWLLAAARVESPEAIADALARVRELDPSPARWFEAERVARRATIQANLARF
ncbi:MAG TPA: hypothetical protein VLC09_04935 [Polyangiaceae bacterium]|nr:hypothetical protein [Polyangiaceae bacterium]